MTRQQRWQQKMLRKGRCIICGQHKRKSPYKRKCIRCQVRSRQARRAAIGFAAWSERLKLGRRPYVKDNGQPPKSTETAMPKISL